MKKIIFIIALLAMVVIGQSFAQDRYLAKNEYPGKITSYVKKHFSNSEITSIKEDKEPLKTEYEVKLANLDELEFNQKYEVIKLKSKKGLPNSVISKNIREYVQQHVSGAVITEWKKKMGNQEIELNNGSEILFDAKGNYIRITD